ncbi:MAG: T9SS type A sorting domain-containing protein, partial [Chlorobi bacterium]|nr:T9SS type A sorting domain-containing protein [Chlorobiota bacterium]
FGAERPISILHQAGTDGGIYLATSNSVYYRDNKMDDWILYSDGLPVNAASNILKPFYRDGKIRMATYGRGIWQCDFYSKSNPVAQPIVDKHTSINLTDTFRFDDYSILNHAGASWEWEFPGAEYVSSSTDRNPKVVYAATGQYDVTLTVTDGDGKTDSKTVINMVTVEQINNTPGILPGLASYTNEKTEFTQIENLGLETNTMTISAWVRPEGIQPDYTGIVMNDGAGAGFNFKQNNMIGYHWPEGGAWWRNSGLIIAAGEWSHVAMVVEPDGITLYVNGISNKHEFTVAKANIGEMKIGRYMSWSGRNYTGFIDEVCIWDRSLTAEEIRESRHNVKNPNEDESIIAYFQFDEEDGLVVNRAGTIHAGMTHGSERLTSTAPFGKGNVNRKDISTGGDISFEDSDVEIDFSNSTADEGSEIVATRIMNAPDTETGHPNTSLGYWIIDDYAANVDFSAITKMKFNSVGEIDADGAADPSVFKLYQRTENADAIEWTLIDEADEATEGPHGDITFSQGLNLEAFGQFIIATDATSLDIEEITKSITNINVYPNPVRSGESIRLSNSNLTSLRNLTNIRFELFDLNGKRVLLSRPASSTEQIQIGDLPAGIYSFRILSDQVMKFGKIV